MGAFPQPSPYRSAGSTRCCLHSAPRCPAPHGTPAHFFPSLPSVQQSSAVTHSHSDQVLNKGTASVQDLSLSLPLPGVLTTHPSPSLLLEGNSSSVGAGTHFQPGRAAHAFAFVSITRCRVSGKKLEYLSNLRRAQPAGSRKNRTLLFYNSKTASTLTQRAPF